MNNSSVSYLRKPLALLGAGLSLFAASAAFAQSPDAGKDETLKLETFTVTGSLIPIAANTPAIPVSVISSVDIQNSGVNTDLLAVLKKTAPYFYGANNIGSDNGNVSSGSSNGGSAVALRNRATLVLINGRRAAVSPVTASGGADFVDVSLIPVSAVERIEVLSDGASATYGSDAVSGVVNIILKTNYRGAEVSGRYGWSPNDGKYSERSYSGVFGAGTDKTNITISTEYKKSDPLIQKDRPWAKGQFRTPSFAGSINIGNDFYYLNPSLNAPPLNTDMTPAQLVAAGIYQGPMSQGAVAGFFDLAEKPTMLIDAQRRSVVAAIDHRLTDSTTVFADFIYSNTATTSVLNAQPVSGAVAAATATNPFDVSVTARNRFVDFPRVYNAENWATRGVFGIKGSFADTWRYEAAANFNNTTTKFRNDGLIDAAAYTAAVANLTFNPFARVQAPGVLAKMIGTSFRDYQSQLVGFDFRVSGELMQLPAGPLAIGFGADTRRESLDFTNDRYDQTGGWLQATPRQPFAANSSVDGYFAEVRVPIFDKGNSISGFHVLEFSAAARKELYNKTTDPFVPKYTIRWLPFNDEFAVRATYSESFSAPSLFNLLGPVSAGFTASININRYDTSGNALGVTTGSRQYRSSSGSNANLIPSQSRNWTAGVVWSPTKGKLKGLEVSADWFNIDERDLVSTIASTTIVQSVERFGTASPYASLVRLGTSLAGETYFGTGTPISTPGQMSGRPSDEVWITNQLVNIAGVWQSGADIKVSYVYDTKTWGVLSGRISGVYLDEYVIQNLPTDAPFDYAGSYSGTSLYARYRIYTQLGWAYKAWDAGVNNTYIPGVDDVAGGAGAPHVNAYSTWDARLAYNFRGSGNRWLKGLSIGAGVNNILNEDPPFILSEGNQNHDINAYDPIGRFYYFDVNYKF